MSGLILHFCGDSHLRPIRHAAHTGMLDPLTCIFTEVGGATAVGLRHPTSKTNALQTYRDALRTRVEGVIPVFQLGEVDCGFVIWYRAKKYKEPVHFQLAHSIHAYTDFLMRVRDDMQYPHLLVSSATLPTIKDGQLDGEVAHLRSEVRATLKERTALTQEYNAELKALCLKEELSFVDVAASLLDEQTGVIQDRFRHPDPADHHLHPEQGARVWASLLIEAIIDLSERQRS